MTDRTCCCASWTSITIRPTHRRRSEVIHEATARGEFVTGLLYVDTNARRSMRHANVCRKRSLVDFDEEALRISRDDWNALMRP